MAITQTKIDRIQEILRQQYILVKDQEIRKLLSTYNGSVDYVLQLLLNNPDFTRAKKWDIDLKRAVDTALDETLPAIIEAYNTAITRMLEIGAGSLLLTLSEGGANVSRPVEKKVNSLIQFGANDLISKGGAISNVLSTMAGSQKGGFSISSNIWDTNRKNDIYSLIRQGIARGDAPFKIAESIKQYSIKGNGFKNAFRLAYTELTHAHAIAQVESVRAWNESGDNQFYLLIEQYLSPLHSQPCICEVLAGLYDPAKAIPKIPRHPHCNCGQRQVIKNARNARNIVTMDERLAAPRNVNLGKQVVEAFDFNELANKYIVNNQMPTLSKKELEFLNEYDIPLKGGGRYLSQNTNGAFDYDSNAIYMNPKVKSFDEINRIFIHELGHAIDYNKAVGRDSLGRPIIMSRTQAFRDSIEFERFEIVNRRIGVGIVPSSVFEYIDSKGSRGGGVLIDYFFSNTELFADAYRQFRQNVDMKEYAPLTHSYMQSIYRTLL